MGSMEHLQLGDVSVEFEVVGTGDPVALLHARPFVSWYGPLVAALAEHAVLWYRRTVAPGRTGFGLGDDADVCARVLDHVGFDRPHVVGHSYGGCLALELARRTAVAPRSIALLEPATSGLLAPDEAMAGLAPLMELYRSRGADVALEQFLGLVVGPDAAERLERLVPTARDDAAANADQFFRIELPALARWDVGPDDFRLGDMPVLNIRGADTDARFVKAAEIIDTWFPQAARYLLPDAGHLLMAERPAETAERLERFWVAGR